MDAPPAVLNFLKLGEISFNDARAIQSDLMLKRVNNLIPDTIIFCEHPATLTRGIRATNAELLVEQEELGKVQIIQTDRGGEWTAHEPGQLVIYPVIDLKLRKLSPKCVVDVLLNTVSSALNMLNIPSTTSRKPAGIFVGSKKIASIGLKISKGITNHGLSLNVSNSLTTFELIVPCGLVDIEMTSASKELGITMETMTMIPIIEQQFINSFGV